MPACLASPGTMELAIGRARSDLASRSAAARELQQRWLATQARLLALRAECAAGDEQAAETGAALGIMARRRQSLEDR